MVEREPETPVPYFAGTSWFREAMADWAALDLELERDELQMVQTHAMLSIAASLISIHELLRQKL